MTTAAAPTGVPGVVVSLAGHSLTAQTDAKGDWSITDGSGVLRRSQESAQTVSGHLVVERGRLRVSLQGRDLVGRGASFGPAEVSLQPGSVARAMESVPTSLVYSFKGKVFLRDTLTDLIQSGIVRVFDTTVNASITHGYFEDIRDGQTYRFVKIGSQTWMAQNLNFKGSGGDSGWAYNNHSDSAKKYGRLYSWASAMGLHDSCNTKNCAALPVLKHQGICPDRWKVPSIAEWESLFKEVGGISVAGKALKSNAGWLYSGNGVDAYGFRVFPAGVRYSDDSKVSLGVLASFLVAEDVSEDNQFTQWPKFFEHSDYSYGGVARTASEKSDGRSLRCVKNDLYGRQDTTLASLAVSKPLLMARFVKSVLAYHVVADSTVDSVTITADASDPINSKVWINGVNGNSNVVVLNEPGKSTLIRVVVHSTDGDSLEYTLNVYRKPVVVLDSMTYANRTYRTVKIGSQTWMAENLNHKGSGVDSGWVFRDNPDREKAFGRLYSWASVMALHDSCNTRVCASQVQPKHRGICPAGWHVPTDAEWDTLMAVVGDSATVGSRLKSRAGWYNGGNGTDYFGFTALPGGTCVEGICNFADNYGYWWSASEKDATSGWFRAMYDTGSKVVRDKTEKVAGFSVRCLAD
ncbi:MAG: cadherin-like beta sandwich domain-containing protein [Fibrobacteres bacterium]|nr:cadherin-like beta sandwich domain-containing protein [Fibrobacterota bacterium]